MKNKIVAILQFRQHYMLKYIIRNTKKLHHVFVFWVVLASLLVVAGSMTIAHQQQARPGSITAAPTPLPETTYTSKALGISFNYIPFFPNGIGQYFFVKEIGNIIYLYWEPGHNQPFSGSDAEFLRDIALGAKSIQVFTKDPQKSLTEGIQAQFLTGYSKNDCFANIQHYSRPVPEDSYQTAIIDFPRKAGHSRQQLEQLVAKCPQYTDSFDSIRYFMMDPAHSDKLLFVTIGQDNLPAEGGGTWDRTIKVLK